MNRAFNLFHKPSTDGTSWTTTNGGDDGQAVRVAIEDFTTDAAGRTVGPDGTVYRSVPGGGDVVAEPFEAHRLDDEAAEGITTWTSGNHPVPTFNVVADWMEDHRTTAVKALTVALVAVMALFSRLPVRGPLGVLLAVLVFLGAVSVVDSAFAVVSDRWELSAPSWSPRSWRMTRRWYGTGRLVYVDGDPARVLDWTADYSFGAGVIVLILWLDGEAGAEWMPLCEVRPESPFLPGLWSDNEGQALDDPEAELDPCDDVAEVRAAFDLVRLVAEGALPEDQDDDVAAAGTAEFRGSGVPEQEAGS